MNKQAIIKFKDCWVKLTYNGRINANVGEVKGCFREFIVFDIGGEMEVIIRYKNINGIEPLNTKDKTRLIIPGRNLYNNMKRKNELKCKKKKENNYFSTSSKR